MKKYTVGMLGVVAGVVGGLITGEKLKTNQINAVDKKIDKFKGYYNLLNQWLSLKHEGKNLDEYFINNDYHNIAIYGMGELGNHLIEELKDSEVKIKYGIDKNVLAVYSTIDIVDVEEMTDNVDVVIVTATFAMDDIKAMLQDKVSCPIVSLEDVVYEL